MSRKALVTGASGLVGQHVVRQLVDHGWWVRVLCRSDSATGELPLDQIERVAGDITDADAVARGCDQPFDAVFHVAASTSMWRRNNTHQTRVNVDGTHNLLMAAREAGVARFVHTSTVSVYGFPEDIIDENTPWDSSSNWINYFRSKREAETLVREAGKSGLDAVILNPANLLGPLDQRNWIQLIRRVAHQDLPGIPPGTGSFADVREVARAHRRAVDHGGSGENYLLGGVNARIADVIRSAAQILEVPVKARPVPPLLLRLLGQVHAIAGLRGVEPKLTPEKAALASQDCRVDSSKAQRALDYRITPLDQLLRDTIDWARSAGALD